MDLKEVVLCLKWLLLSWLSPLPQGLMFGYATDETEECMPLTIILAHKLNSRMADLRRSGVLPWLRPDSKTQVSLFFASLGAPDIHFKYSQILLILVPIFSLLFIF